MPIKNYSNGNTPNDITSLSWKNTKWQNIWEDNFIYISHLDDIAGIQYWYLPWWPDTVSDSMGSSFQETQALGRSAPVFTFNNAGPRSVQIDISLHRDMMDDININRSNVKLVDGEDYVESLLHAIQAIALPRYNLSNKAVEPPLVALRLGKDIFVKGIVDSGIGLTYEKPILSDDKYAVVRFSFNVKEVDPYDASTVYTNGSFRGVLGKSSNNILKDRWEYI